MQRPLSSRKRSAPGVDQTLQQPQHPFSDLGYQPAQDSTNAFGGQYMDWDNTDGLNNVNPHYGDQPTFDSSLYDTGLNAPLGLGGGLPIAPAPPSLSGQLVRRNPNQQLATRGRTWQDGASAGMQQTQTQNAWDDEDESELEQRALAAKREAQAKRKQIPPFVQKLSSFLDESNNTDLIRWSDDGRSFIVLDEDEFAKTLIPELFKHNNYASFVRQLNMYGFHKKVGLSDNSMKASENKRKTPSEYWNKYFRRGRPELLWLIQKPKNPPTAKRKREEGKKEEDSDDERRATTSEIRAGSEGPHGLSQDLTVIPKTELAGLRNELVTLQRQQKLISGVINQIKRQNDQMYQQAQAFQALHDRHESSINAILTFLATFYNRSLEGHGSANLADIFSHALNQNQTQQGNIVDMGDLTGVDLGMNTLNQGQTPNRRRQPLALLPAPDAKPAKSPVTLPPSARSTVSPKPKQQPIFRPQTQHEVHSSVANAPPARPSHGPSPVTLKSETESPKYAADTHDIMSVINAANAATPTSTGQSFDINSALDHFENAGGNVPLTPERRNEVLNIIASTTNANAPTAPTTAAANVENALTDPQPPPMPQLSQISQTQEQLDMLQRLQEEQAAKVRHLAERLGPLSPSGEIPLYHDAAVNGATVPPPEWSLDDWIDDPHGFSYGDSKGFPWGAPTFDTNDTNFDNDLGLNYDAKDDHGVAAGSNGLGIGNTEHELFRESPTTQKSTGGRAESASSRATSPTATADTEDKSDVGSPRKRRRTGGQLHT